MIRHIYTTEKALSGRLSLKKTQQLINSSSLTYLRSSLLLNQAESASYWSDDRMKPGAAEQSSVSLSLNRHVVCLPACCAAYLCKWPWDNMSSHWTQVRDVSEREDQKWPEGFFVFSVWVWFIICPHLPGNNLGMTMKEVFCVLFASFFRHEETGSCSSGGLENCKIFDILVQQK